MRETKIIIKLFENHIANFSQKSNLRSKTSINSTSYYFYSIHSVYKNCICRILSYF